MKISDIKVVPLSFTMKEPIMDSFCITEKRNVVLVEVITDNGLIGYGEAGCYGGSMAAVSLVIEKEIKPLLIGQDPILKERMWNRIYKKYYQHGRGGILITALSGIDIALWDLTGKVAGMPVYKLLGGYKNKVRAYASGGFYQEEKGLKELCEEMKGYTDTGFTAVKMKIGRTSSLPTSKLQIIPAGNKCEVSLQEDIERVRYVRKAIGEDIDLLVDANNGWDVESAIKMARELEKYNVYYIEEPLLTEDKKGSAMLADKTTIPIAGYETAYTRYEFKDLIEMRAVDIVQPDTIWTGGISECMKIAAMASAHNLPVIPHGFSSAICLAANLHFTAAISNGVMVEFDRSYNPLRDDIIKKPFDINQDSLIEIGDKPGLGIELDEEVIKEYTVERSKLYQM